VTLPAAGESRFKPDQVVVVTPPGFPKQRVAAILRRHRLTEIDSAASLSGISFHVWLFKDHRSVAKVEQELAREIGLKALQPNFVYVPTEDLASVSTAAATPGLYALEKLRVAAGLDLAGAAPVKVAVVDTAIDEDHPDLVGVVEDRFDAIGGGKPPNSLDHGTAMAGAIAAKGQVRGVAPSVRILSARAFDTDGAGGALGSSMTIVKAIDWSVRSGARVINMSFAGPKDPALHETLAAAAKKSVVLIAAMGNAGPKSPPLFPGADENVIAITATDAEDRIFPMANVGAYVAAAAPGVDVLLPAPHGGYSLETGTSVSAALASGVAALEFERKPRATVQDIRKWLIAGARRPALAMDKTLIGAGVIDATATMLAIGGDGLAGR
jgi:subtilisin family serine protease